MVTVFRSHGFYIFHFYIFHFYIYQLLLLFCFEVVEEEEKEKGESEKTKHIFISYNHTHQDVVRQVAERLKVSHTLYCEIYFTMVFKPPFLEVGPSFRWITTLLTYQSGSKISFGYHFLILGDKILVWTHVKNF